jgi:hypothetical protein
MQLPIDAIGKVPHANGAPPLEQQLGCVRIGDDMQIPAPLGRTQIGLCIAAALAVLLRDMVVAHAILLDAVEVVVRGVPGFARRRQIDRRHRIGLAQARDIERPALPVQCIVAGLEVLQALEVGQHLAPAPAAIAELRPVIVVPGVTADHAHRVDRRTAAERASARPVQPASAHQGLLRGPELPVIEVRSQHCDHACWHTDQRAAIRRSGLDQAHAIAAVGAQAIGQYTASGAAADDDKVVHPSPFGPIQSGNASAGLSWLRPISRHPLKPDTQSPDFGHGGYRRHVTGDRP